VRNSVLAVLLTASLASAAVAADRNPRSLARPDVVAPGHIYVHQFVDVKGIKEATTKIFVSDAANNVVDIYNTAGKQLAQLTGFSEPQGLATDSKGNLYVADTANSRIQVYAPPYTKTPKSYADSGQYPAGVSVTIVGKVTYVGVTNIISTSGGPGSVTIYKNGKAGAAISSSDFGRVYFDSFDASGNLYIDGENSSGAVVVGEIAKATTTGKKIAVLKTKNSIEFPGGIEVTTKGLIAIDDQDAATVYSYKAPVKGSLGNPAHTTPVTGSSDAVTFAFTSTNADLWTADAGNEDSAEFAYPKGGSALHSIPVTGGEPIGVAIVPAEVPGK
jgi:sugar lactone lactonase YvrE